jgi:polysaccharide deacetylase family protein (PEP-CTERM system associated)
MPVGVHHFSVDVEEYFQVSAFESYVSRKDWDRIESRVGAGLQRLLALLEQRGSRGTFFVLGWVADRHPNLVREIASRGHEVASHGWDHRRVTEQRPEEFRTSVRRSKALLEDVAGAAVVGFRAPSFSIVPGLEWALDILVEEGYRYDSSLFPVRRRGYGYAAGARDPHWREWNGRRLFEVPPATLRLLGQNLPAGGGAYFRLFPYGVVRRALIEAGARGAAGTFYIHPWELDPEQPRLTGIPWSTRARHYGGLGRVVPRLERLLAEFQFRPIAENPGFAEAGLAVA